MYFQAVDANILPQMVNIDCTAIDAYPITTDFSQMETQMRDR